MEQILRFDLALPIILSLLAMFVFAQSSIWVLHKTMLLTSPLAGAEWSKLVLSASILFSVMWNASVLVEPMFHTYQTLLASSPALSTLITGLLSNWIQFLLLLFFVQILFGAIVCTILRFFYDLKKMKAELASGNLPFAILACSAILGGGIFTHAIGSQLLDMITPYVLNFR